MNKFLSTLLLTLAFTRLDLVAEAAVPQKPNFEILFVKDLVKYVRSNPDAQLRAFNYDQKEGFTYGKKWDNKLFDLDYDLVDFKDESFGKRATYTYPGDVTVDIQHIQLSYKESTTNPGNVFLKEGGIGQSFVSLVVEVPDSEESTLTCHVSVTGDIYDVIN